MTLETTLKQIDSKNFEIEVFGLGYVGFPLAVRLSSSGFKVTGIDTDPVRMKRLENNSLRESEINLKDEFLHSRELGNLKFKEEPISSKKPKIGIICVPTPIPKNEIESDVYVKTAIENFLKASSEGDVIIIESSIQVGTTEKMKQIIESKGFKVGVNYGLIFCPERIDPQNKKWNLKNIPRVIYCSGDTTYRIAQKIYYHVNNSNLIRVNSSEVAEVVKSYENAFRLVNISLVNELAILCDALKIKVSDVIAAASTKPFGFMPFYPGAGVGGHCIPKDPLFLSESARKFGFDFNTINVALVVNSFIPKYISEIIQAAVEKMNLSKSILVIGLTYKPNVEDMRDSPGFKIVKELHKKNYEISIFDPYYKKELEEKYTKENDLFDVDFEVLEDITDDKIIKNFDCICIVQHHSETKLRIKQIYQKSLVSYILDCGGKLIHNPHSTTILKSFGA